MAPQESKMATKFFTFILAAPVLANMVYQNEKARLQARQNSTITAPPAMTPALTTGCGCKRLSCLPESVSFYMSEQEAWHSLI
jgi:hypothetical protein